MANRPRGFVTCYICEREFGSQSILFHEPQCLQKWRNNNNRLPKSRRCRTPTKEGRRVPLMEGSRKISRPGTATLDHPRVLDINDMGHVDMTIIQRRPNRPLTFSLVRPTVAKVPHVEDDTTRKTGNAKNVVYVVENAVPEPCQSCETTAHPERLHSHPKKPPDFKIVSTNGRVHNGDGHGRSEPKNATRDGSEAANDADLATVKDRGNHQKLKGPGLQTCPICGRQFGSKSLPLHQPKCLEKWQIENDRLPKRLQQSQPQEPDGDGSSGPNCPKYLLPCPKCGRTFFPDRLTVHTRVCQGQRPDTRPTSERLQSTNTPKSLPASSTSGSLLIHRFAICYICGREFGSKSIRIHEPQCLKKWQVENSMLPKHMQRAEPVKPDITPDGDGIVNLEELAKAAWQSHLGQLVRCPKCDRTFNPDRLKVHERACQRTSRRNFV